MELNAIMGSDVWIQIPELEPHTVSDKTFVRSIKGIGLSLNNGQVSAFGTVKNKPFLDKSKELIDFGVVGKDSISFHRVTKTIYAWCDKHLPLRWSESIAKKVVSDFETKFPSQYFLNDLDLYNIEARELELKSQLMAQKQIASFIAEKNETFEFSSIGSPSEEGIIESQKRKLADMFNNIIRHPVDPYIYITNADIDDYLVQTKDMSLKASLLYLYNKHKPYERINGSLNALAKNLKASLGMTLRESLVLTQGVYVFEKKHAHPNPTYRTNRELIEHIQRGFEVIGFIYKDIEAANICKDIKSYLNYLDAHEIVESRKTKDFDGIGFTHFKNKLITKIKPEFLSKIEMFVMEHQ